MKPNTAFKELTYVLNSMQTALRYHEYLLHLTNYIKFAYQVI
jgi:hypothetical protein